MGAISGWQHGRAVAKSRNMDITAPFFGSFTPADLAAVTWLILAWLAVRVYHRERLAIST